MRPIFFSERTCLLPDGQPFSPGRRRLELPGYELSVLGRKQHREHVIDRSQLERTRVPIEERHVAEMSIGVRDQGAERIDETDLLGIRGGE